LIKIIGNRNIAEMIAVFVIVLAVGMLIAVEAVKTSMASIVYSTMSNPKFVVFSYFLDATFIVIIAMLLVKRHAHHSNTFLFEALEGIVTSFTAFFVFLLVIALLSPQTATDGSAYVMAAVIAVALVLLKDKWHRLRDFNTAVSSIGVGLVLGLNFHFIYAMLVLAAVAVYDYIVIFKTREMVSMAREFASEDIAFLISVSDLEAVPERGLSQAEIDAYVKNLKKAHGLDNPESRKILQSGRLPVVSQVALGEGDLSLPLMASISAYTSIGLLFSAIVLLGSIAGIVSVMLILKWYKRPIPAIPPLFAFIGMFAGAGLIVTSVGVGLYTVGAVLMLAGTFAMLIDMATMLRREEEIKRKKKAALS
jgi:presenilin-like A22 family membrane protease